VLHSHSPRADHAGQHPARPDQRPLVDITNNQEGSAVRQRFQRRVHERHFHHGSFVNDKKVGFDGVTCKDETDVSAES
jgi:hypothetical protein